MALSCPAEPRWLRVTPALLGLFGLIYCLIIPPFQSPDESNHFLKAWQVSEGQWRPERTAQRLGGDLPVSVAQISRAFDPLRQSAAVRLEADTFWRWWSVPTAPVQRAFADFPNTATYAPWSYAPQSLAIALLRPLGVGPLPCLYGARLLNFFVWWLLVCAALPQCRFPQLALAMTLCLPASLVMAASANPDVMIQGLSWWLVAVLLFGSPQRIKTFLTTAMVAGSKLITWPLALLAFIRPQARRLCWPLLLVALAIAGAWAYWAGRQFIPYDAYDPAFRDTQTLNSGVSPGRQLAFVLQHPLYFIRITAVSLWEALPSMAAHFTGKFGWERNYLPAHWIGLLWLALAALLCCQENPWRARQRCGMAAIVCLYGLGFALTMYALWCAVGAGAIHNWQARYFTPVAPVLWMVLGNGRLVKWRNPIGNLALLIVAAANLAMVWAIYQRYF